jgi:acyl-[acyl-carrier-protein]-phospholipid O-acyltransferase/long-chain-fatty-acid--[acyl-carrier-protein] ligase
MDNNKLYLLKERKFLPLFATQFLGAFNDNVLKSALSFTVIYKSLSISWINPGMMVNLALGLFVLPFVIFGGIAGQVADKYEKSSIVRVIKIFEIFIIFLASIGFYHTNLILLLFCLFLMGVHSTFFGPIKYSIIPEHLEKDELLSANAFIEAGTFLSILCGSLVGGACFMSHIYLLSAIMFISAFAGVVSSFYIPKSTVFNSDLKINTNIIQENIIILKYSLSKKQIFLSILGISWFWFISSTFSSMIPVFAKDILGANESVANLFFIIFSIGVGVGSLSCNRIYKNEITSKYVFLASIGISIFGIDLYFASNFNPHPAELINLTKFFSSWQNLRIIIDTFMLSVIGGIYVVPLFAIMQTFSSPLYRSRVIAAHNIVSSAFMVGSALIVMVLIMLGFNVAHVFLIISILNMVVAIYSFKLIPDAKIIPDVLLKGIFKFAFNKLYRVEIRGIENYHKAGKRSVIIANHISYLDPALLSVFLPDNLIFAINTDVAQQWWVKPFLKVVKTYPIDPTNAMAAKTLISEVKKDQKIAIFPEGRLSVTGSLMKVYEGPGMIADKAGATILPIRIDGPQFTSFSKLRKFSKSRMFPKVTITILPPVNLDLDDTLEGRDRRKLISHKLYDIMSGMMFESSGYKKPIFQSLIDAAKIYGFDRKVLNDFEHNIVSYRQLIMKSYILGDAISKMTHPGEFVGIMLPNSSNSVACFFALQAFGRVPAMLNFSSGIANLVSACKTAKIRTVYTSRKFISRANLEDVAEQLSKEVDLFYLEDFKSKISVKDKIVGAIGSYFPQTYYNTSHTSDDSKIPAVILFTSGTEGQPKAVVLSHQNILANVWQMAAKVDFGTHDSVFNALPMFHSFGLTAGTILPSLFGIMTFMYPSPLHYRVIPELIYDVGSTILFGTDTFLSGYANFADPYDFYSIRYVFAGAEKLKSNTRKLWFDKYGLRIFEGYGTTEAAPVVSVNTPMHDRPGSVGRPMPSVETKIKAVDGISEGGRLFIKGPNIMLGYIFATNPGVIVPVTDEDFGNGWYDTGDIVSIDEDGYLKIQGRAKRFAKIAGEMISLSMVEDIAASLYPDSISAAITISHEKKGEQIVLFTNKKDFDKIAMLQHAKNKGMSELCVPKEVIYLNEIPVLSTGKTNYRELILISEKYLEKDNETEIEKK